MSRTRRFQAQVTLWADVETPEQAIALLTRQHAIEIRPKDLANLGYVLADGKVLKEPTAPEGHQVHAVPSFHVGNSEDQPGTYCFLALPSGQALASLRLRHGSQGTWEYWVRELLKLPPETFVWYNDEAWTPLAKVVERYTSLA